MEFDRLGALRAGYSNEEIDAYIKAQNTPVPSEAFLDRLAKGTMLDRLFASAGKGAVAGFGDQPLGLEHDSETSKFLEENVFKGPLRSTTEAFARPAAAAIDAVMRGGQALGYGAAGLLTQIYKEAPSTPFAKPVDKEAEGNKLQRDLAMLSEIAPIVAGTGGNLHRINRDPMGRIHEEPIGGMPTPQDFKDAATAATGGEPAPHVAEKLDELYREKGEHPAEAVHDAQTDPIKRQELLYTEPEAIEIISKPAVRFEGQVFEGHLHLDAMYQAAEALKKEGEDVSDALLRIAEHPTFEEGFTTSTGRFVGRKEAVGLAKDQLKRNIELAAEGLHSKDLKEGKEPGVPALRRTSEPTGGGGGEGEPPGGEPLGTPGEEPKRIPGQVGIEATATPNLEAAKKKVLENISIGEKDRTGPRMDAYTATVDRLFPIKQEVKKAKAAGVDVEAWDDPYIGARLYAGWTGKAEVALKYEGPFNFFTYENVGRPLAKIWQPIRDQLEDFRAFVVAARATEIEKIKGKVSGVDLAAAKVVGENAPGHYKQAMLDTVEFENHVARYLRDAQVISRAGYAGLVESNKFFVPWHRILNEEGIGITPVGNSLQAKNPIHRLKGDTSKIVDPLESVIKNTYIYHAMAEKNAVGLKLVDMMQQAQKIQAELKPAPGRDLIVRTVSTEPTVPFDAELYDHLHETYGLGAKTEKMVGKHGDVPFKLEDPNLTALVDFIKEAASPVAEDEIRVFRNGRPERYKVDVQLARAFKSLDRDSIGLLEKLFAPAARGLRAGVVFSPDFMARHLIRGTIYAGINYEHGIFTPLDTARGIGGLARSLSPDLPGMKLVQSMTGEWTPDKDFVNWLKGGGGRVGIQSLDRNTLQNTLNDLVDSGGLKDTVQNVVGNPWEATKKATNEVIRPFEIATQLATEATHLGGFKKRMRQLEEGGVVAPGTGYTPLGGIYEALKLGKLNTDDLPALRNQDLRLHEGMSTAEGLKAFGFKVEDGTFDETFPGKDSQFKKNVIDAAWTSRNTDIDMARIGAKMRSLNMISAFLNAKIQDTFTILERMISNPARALPMIGALVVFPSAVLWAIQHDDSRYKEIEHWQKDDFWIWLTNKWENATPQQAANRPADQVRLFDGQLQVNNGPIFRIPKPFSTGVFFGSGTERLMEAYLAENPKAWDSFIHSIYEQTLGDVMPNMIQPMWEQATNESRLSGRKIIPGNLEHLLPEYQYKPYTTEAAKKLGMLLSSIPGMHEATNAPVIGPVARALQSPLLIENYVRSWTGTMGLYALQAADAGLRKAGVVPEPNKPEGQLADIPFVRAFTVRHPGAGQSVTDFYDAFNRIKSEHDTYKQLEKVGDTAGMERIQAAGGPEMFARLDGYQKTLRMHSALINKIYDNPQIEPAQKRQLIDNSYYAMTQVAKQGLSIVEGLRKGQQP